MTLAEKLNLTDSALDRNVKVAGTDYDRRRRLTNKQIYEIKRSYTKSKDPQNQIQVLASRYDVDPNTIRYHVDEEFKRSSNLARVARGFNKNNNYVPAEYRAELAEYKRTLLRMGKRLPAYFN